jgi:solute carrier family 41
MSRYVALYCPGYSSPTNYNLQRWKAMRSIDELIMIIPVILNLKGNLEMNLSARLGTAANVGELDDPETRSRIIFGNLSLLQVQATVVSFVAACVSVILSLIVPKISSQPGSPASNNTSLAAYTTLYHRSRRPRPPLPVNDGRPRSGFAEYVVLLSLIWLMTLTQRPQGSSW